MKIEEGETAKKLCLWIFYFIDISFPFIYSVAVSYAPGINSAGSFPGFPPRTRNRLQRSWGKSLGPRTWRLKGPPAILGYIRKGLWTPTDVSFVLVIRGLWTDAEQPSVK
jgi:hypothetical protein